MSRVLPQPAAVPARRPYLVRSALRRLQRTYQLHAASATEPLPAFQLVLDDDSAFDFGAGERAFTVQVRSPAGRAALASLDETRFAVAYMAGDIDLEGEILNLLQLRPLLSDRHPLRELWAKTLHPLIFGQVRSDREWIAQHYDEDADFYLSFLDRRGCYSQGVFEAPDEALDDAIERKLDFALAAVGAEPGQRILDIGAGWGAMTEHAGRRGVEVTSLTLSKPSEQYVQALIQARDLPCRVLREHFLEHRSTEPYDAIVNLGVTEHLPDYAASLEQYRRLLKPGGRVYLDASASRRKFPFSSFIYRFVFPGNATPLCLHDYLTEVAKTPFEVLAVHNDRESYLLTCLHWAQNLERARSEIERRYSRSQFRRFQLYLWGSVDAFERYQMDAYRVVLRLPG